MPPFVISAILALLPVTFIFTIFEIFGLVVVVPVIQILVNPSVIEESSILNSLYRAAGSPVQSMFVLYLLGLSVIFFLVKNALVFWASRKQTRLVYDTASRLTQLQFQEYIFQPFEKHVEENSSIVLRKVIEIPYNFCNGIMLPLVQLSNEVLVAILITIGILVYSPVLFLSMALFITPFLVSYVLIYKKRLRKISQEREAGHSEMFRKGRQSVDGFREILLFDKFGYFGPLFNAAVKRFSNAMARIYHLNLFSPKIIETLAILCVFGIFAMGILLDYNIQTLVTFLATFAIAAYRLIPSVNKIIYAYNNIRSTEFVFDHFKKSEVSAATLRKVPLPDPQPVFLDKLELSNVSFSFHDGKEVLTGVNLRVMRGEIIGIMGKSGSGKSTLINIILGLLPPTRGSILIDERDLDESLLRAWHRAISFVPQSPTLIEGTVLENVAFGVPIDQVDHARVEWCVEHSGLTEYVKDLPMGLDSFIGDKNLNISGGQKQRLAIARALYHKGKFLIFDEATSSLDRETEDQITESIRALQREGYTILIVAHRPNALKFCDKIYTVKDGMIGDPINFNEVYER